MQVPEYVMGIITGGTDQIQDITYYYNIIILLFTLEDYERRFMGQIDLNSRGRRVE